MYYNIYIIKSDGTYEEDLVNCDGTSTSVMESTSCIMPVATLRAEPFNLDWGTSVYVKIRSTNIKGDSIVSEPGNGGAIITYADAPYNLVEDMSTKTATSIGLSWTEPDSNGGSEII
jgi:hypothetical protein